MQAKTVDYGILQEYQTENIKLDATHSQMKMRLAEITFD